MQDSKLTSPTYKKDGMTIVDVDVHAHETPAALAPYIEMPWRKTLEHLSTVPARYLDIPGFAPSLAPWPSFPNSGGDRRNTVTSAAQMRQDLDDLGVDIAVIFPDHLLSHAAIKQDDYAVALARAYNRWLVEEWLTQDNGLQGRHDRAAPQPGSRRGRDPALRHAPARGGVSTCPPAASTRCTATAATTRCMPPPRKPACR